MMAVHVLPAVDPDGSLALTDAIARGRSAAAFAVLAGVSLALANGGTRPLRGRAWAAGAVGLLVRAGLIGVIGLTLGGLGSGVAVILVYYALLFVGAAALLAAPVRVLAPAAVVACLATPVLSHLLRQDLPAKRGSSPSWADLSDLGTLLTEITLTGYYPLLAWTTYLLAGMAVGRLALASRRVAWTLLVLGAGTAVASTLAADALVASGVAAGALPEEAADMLVTGTTPTGTWWWLVVDSPHASTALDLAHTTGTALALLGGLLLLEPVLGRVLLPLAWVGGMTLTLYTLHVVALASGVGPVDREELYLVHVLVAFALAAAWRAGARRGPLEQLVAWPAHGAARRVASR